MAATTEELRQQLVAKRLKRSTGLNAQNQYLSAPPAPAAPPATAAGLAAAVQPAGTPQAAQPAPGTTAVTTQPQTPAQKIARGIGDTQPAATTPTTPAIPTTQRGSSWQGTGPDPRDATYYSDIAKLNSDINIAEANLDLQTTQKQIGHDQAAGAYAHQNELNIKGTRQANARGGVAYSTQGGNAIGEVEYAFAQQNAANDQDLANWLSSAELSRKALEAGYSVDEAAALAASTYRKAQLDALLPKPETAAATPATGPAPGNPPQFDPGPSPGPGWTWNGTAWINNPKPGEHYVWNPQQNRWQYTGPAPGPTGNGKGQWYWTGDRWAKH